MLVVSMVVMLGVFDMSLGHQTSWTGCPYSSLHCQYSSLCCQKIHGSGLAGLMVLKGIVFGLFFPFLHWMVLKGGAVMTYGLQMSLIPSVDSAVGALDHVRSSTFEYLNHGTSCPLDGACGLLVLEELDLFFHLERMQIFGSMGSVKLFFLFLLQFNKSVRSAMYIDPLGWS